MENLTVGDLTISVDESASGVIRLNWTGRSGSQSPWSTLRPFIGMVHALAAEKSAVIEMHFELLTFFNSSTIAAVIQMIRETRAKKLKLRLVYDASLRWQAHNFEALRILKEEDGLLELVATGHVGAAQEKIKPQ